MKDEDPKPGVVIDVSPEEPEGVEQDEPREPASADSEPAATESEKKARGGNALSLVLAIVALIAVGAASFFAYQHWLQLKSDLAALDARLREAQSQQQQLGQMLDGASEAVRAQETALGEQRELLTRQQAAMDEARANFQQQEQQLAEENVNLQEREAELRAAVADVHRRVGRSGTQWMIAEAEYLLRIANDRLILARDTNSARVALGLADQRLRDTKDPGWAGVREQIARDIAKLSAFEAPDSAGISARLAALIEQIPQLKIARATIGPERTLPQRTADEPGQRSWETLLEDVWSGFKDSVRIRERDTPVQAMLAPEHQFFLYENLKLHLEAARLGLARGDQALFRDNLTIAANWLGKYFDPESGSATAIGDAIGELLEVDIRPPVPDVSQSLRALQVRQKLMEDVAPSGVQEP
jgi:uroporphyrin-3 C-methyltransferase